MMVKQPTLNPPPYENRTCCIESKRSESENPPDQQNKTFGGLIFQHLVLLYYRYRGRMRGSTNPNRFAQRGGLDGDACRRQGRWKKQIQAN